MSVKPAVKLNYLISDGGLVDFVQEVAEYIDELNGTSGETIVNEEDEEATERLPGSYEKHLLELLDTGKEDELFKSVVEESKVFVKGPEMEFESIYSLVFQILSYSPNFDTLFLELLDNLVATPTPENYTNGSLLILSILGNAFNVLPVDSPLRKQVFERQLSYAETTKSIHFLVSQLTNLESWIDSWSSTDEEKGKTFSRISKAVSDDDSGLAYKYLEKSVLNWPANVQLTTELVKLALASDHVYKFDDILALKAIQTNLKASDSSLVTLLEIVSEGDLEKFKSFDRSSIKNFDWGVIEKKAKIIALAAYISKSAKRTILYKDIATAIGIDSSEVEVWIIDAIRAGLVEGRLSQVEQNFDVHRVTPVGQFGEQEWKDLDERLQEWRASARRVLDVVRNAKENAIRESKKV